MTEYNRATALFQRKKLPVSFHISFNSMAYMGGNRRRECLNVRIIEPVQRMLCIAIPSHSYEINKNCRCVHICERKCYVYLNSMRVDDYYELNYVSHNAPHIFSHRSFAECVKMKALFI